MHPTNIMYAVDSIHFLPGRLYSELFPLKLPQISSQTLGCTGLWWSVLDCTGLYWAVIGSSVLYLAVLG